MTTMRLFAICVTLSALIAVARALWISILPSPLPQNDPSAPTGFLPSWSHIEAQNTDARPAKRFAERELEVRERRTEYDKNADGTGFIWLPEDTYAGKTFFE